MLPNIKELTVFAPAKINLHLAVKDKRTDGFHNIESVFLAVDFGDFLRFQFDSGNLNNECIINAGSPDIKFDVIPIQNNIIYKAVSIFRLKTGFSRKVIINLRKNIPVGGGLGGGSSDAAAALTALNEAAGFPCGLEDLLEMGEALGSDVPFFIHRISAALVTGRGEIIKPVKIPEMYLALVNPGFNSNTSDAFKLLDEYRKSGKLNEESKNADAEFINRLDIINISSFSNSFLPVFNEPEKAVYLDIISQLENAGAEFASLSGSGSTCFGVFSDWEKAQDICSLLSKKWYFVKAAKTYRF